MNETTIWDHKYNSWADFIKALKAWTPSPNATQHSQNDESDNTIPWSGAYTFEEAMGFLTDGWKAGLERIREIQRTIPPDLFDGIMPVRDYKPEFRHQISGGSLDVGTYVSGATPECFVSEQVPHDSDNAQIQQGKKLLTIYMQSSNSSYCDIDSFMYRGAYMYALVEHLENCGYSVEFWNVDCSSAIHDSNKVQRIYVKVKEFGELFDQNKMAVALASNFYLRRFLFALQETYSPDEITYITNGSYGLPMNVKIEDVALPEDMDLNPICIGYVNVGTPEETLKRYKEILEKWLNSDVITE